MREHRRRCPWRSLLPALMGAVLTGSFARAEDPLLYDFRGRDLPPEVKLFGPQTDQFIRVEAQGLRIALPAWRKNLAPVGLSVPVVLYGDFEITTTFEILEAETPETGYGVGILLGLNQAVRVGRLVRAKGEQVVVWDQTLEKGKGQITGQAFPCDARVGRLRLQRTGNTLHFLWAPDVTGAEFQEIHQRDYTPEIREIRLVAQTNRQPCGLDVRLLDLRISENPERSRTFRWVAMATVVAVAAGVLGWFLVKRRRLPPLP